MNDSEFGLTASIWTKDPDAAVTIGNEIDTGTWFMNRCDCMFFIYNLIYCQTYNDRSRLKFLMIEAK